MPKTTYLANKVLDLLYGNVAYSIPSTVYVALFTVAPTIAGGGTEVTGGSYARVSVTNNLTNFPAATSGGKSNATVFTWPLATAGWGTVVAVALMDAVSGGNMLHFASIPTKTVDSGDTVSIAATGLAFTES